MEQCLAQGKLFPTFLGLCIVDFEGWVSDGVPGLSPRAEIYSLFLLELESGPRSWHLY